VRLEGGLTIAATRSREKRSRILRIFDQLSHPVRVGSSDEWALFSTLMASPVNGEEPSRERPRLKLKPRDEAAAQQASIERESSGKSVRIAR
jgi:hypothetical protein